MDVMTPPAPAATPPHPADPARAPAPAPAAHGSLGIKERKTWRTSQVILFCILAMLLGMRLGYSGEKKRASSGTVAPGQSGLPPAPSTATTATPGNSVQSTATTATTATGGPGGSSATTATGQPADGSGNTGAPQVLLEVAPSTGGLTTETFTVAPGGWKLGWSFNCRGQSGPFSVTVRRPGGGELPEDPPLQRNATTDKGIESFSSEGAHVLVVQTSCLWALKVTGIPG